MNPGVGSKYLQITLESLQNIVWESLENATPAYLLYTELLCTNSQNTTHHIHASNSTRPILIDPPLSPPSLPLPTNPTPRQHKKFQLRSTGAPELKRIPKVPPSPSSKITSLYKNMRYHKLCAMPTLSL